MNGRDEASRSMLRIAAAGGELVGRREECRVVCGTALDGPLALTPGQAVLFVALAGEVLLRRGNEVWRVRPGAFALLPRGATEAVPYARSRWIALQADLPVMLQLMGLTRLDERRPWLPEWYDTLYAPRAQQLLAEHRSGRFLGTTPELRRCLLELGQQLFAYVQRAPGRTRGARTHALERLLRVRNHVLQVPASATSLDELARLGNYSRWHLRRLFESVFEESAHELMRRARLEESRRLLSDATLSVAEVAAHVGFDHPSAFCRAFRAQYGTSPSRYRSGLSARDGGTDSPPKYIAMPFAANGFR